MKMKRINLLLNPNREGVKLFRKNLPQTRYLKEFKEVDTNPPIISNFLN